MATPRGAEHRDLEQRLRKIEQALQSLTGAALRRRQLSVDSGDFVVSGGGSVIVKDTGNIKILDGAGNVAWSALDGPVKTAQVFVEDRSMNVSDTFHDYGLTSIAVPAGYTKAVVMATASAGASFPNSGSVTVQPVINEVPGPAINSGSSTIAVATSFFSTSLAFTPGQSSFTVRLGAARAGVATSGSGNWHLSALVLFTR